MASKYSEAVRQLLESELRCPKCSAMNRPGAPLIQLASNGEADCGVCSHHWRPEAA